MRRLGNRRPALRSHFVGEADDAERRTGMADEHRRRAAPLDVLGAGVERRRAQPAIFEEPVAADDRRHRTNRRFGAEAWQGAKRRAGR